MLNSKKYSIFLSEDHRHAKTEMKRKVNSVITKRSRCVVYLTITAMSGTELGV